MKTLILYASKYGAAKEIAQRIAKKIEGALVCDIKQKNLPALSDFDCVIIGSSVYAGSLRSEAKAYAATYAGELSKKNLGLFISGFTEDDSYFAKNYPASLVQSAKPKGFFGGIYDPKKANWFERFIVKIVAKESEYTDRIDNSKIEAFVEALMK